MLSEVDGLQPACTPARARAAAEERGVALGVCVNVYDEAAVIDLARVGGSAGQGHAAIADGVGRAIGEAYRRAELALTLGAEGLLRVGCTPQGALATLDGEPSAMRRSSAGSHRDATRCACRSKASADAERTVDVERGRVLDLDVRLAPRGRRAEPGCPHRDIAAQLRARRRAGAGVRARARLLDRCAGARRRVRAARRDGRLQRAGALRRAQRGAARRRRSRRWRAARCSFSGRRSRSK